MQHPLCILATFRGHIYYHMQPAKLFSYLPGQIIQHSAVDQLMPMKTVGFKDRWYRHGGHHCIQQSSPVEYNLLPGININRDTPVGDGKVFDEHILNKAVKEVPNAVGIDNSAPRKGGKEKLHNFDRPYLLSHLLNLLGIIPIRIQSADDRP